MKKIVLPLALLASISTLTSCTTKTETSLPESVVTPQAVVETQSPAPAPTPDVMTPPTTPAPAPADGTTIEASGTVTVSPVTALPVVHTQTVSYNTPAGPDDVEFSVTVADGIITAASATPKATHDISKKLQTSFAGEISSKVVGKKISELSLSAVGGASLTTGAFNQFVQSF